MQAECERLKDKCDTLVNEYSKLEVEKSAEISQKEYDDLKANYTNLKSSYESLDAKYKQLEKASGSSTSIVNNKNTTTLVLTGTSASLDVEKYLDKGVYSVSCTNSIDWGIFYIYPYLNSGDNVFDADIKKGNLGTFSITTSGNYTFFTKTNDALANEKTAIITVTRIS